MSVSTETERAPAGRLWITWLSSRVGLPPYAIGLLVGVAVFLVGLLVAACVGLLGVFVGTRVFWLAAVLVGWESAWLAWGVEAHDKLVTAITGVVRLDARTLAAVKREMRAMTSNRLPVSAALLAAAAAAVYLFLVFRSFGGNDTAVALCFPRVLPEVFYDGERMVAKLTLLGVFDILVTLVPLATAVALFLRSIRIMKLLAACPMAVPYHLALARLDSLGGFYAKVAASWFGGVAIFVLEAESKLTLTIAGVVIAASSLGIVVFFLPQSYWGRALERAKEELLGSLARVVASLSRAGDGLSDARSWLESEGQIISVTEQHARLRTRTFALSNVLQVLLGYVVPLLSTLLQYRS